MLDEVVTYEFGLKDIGLVEVIRLTTIRRDGEPVGKPEIHRSVIEPDTDISVFPEDVQSAILAWWTPGRVEKYSAARERAIRQLESQVRDAALTTEGVQKTSIIEKLSFGMLGKR